MPCEPLQGDVDVLLLFAGDAVHTHLALLDGLQQGNGTEAGRKCHQDKSCMVSRVASSLGRVSQYGHMDRRIGMGLHWRLCPSQAKAKAGTARNTVLCVEGSL